MIYHNIIMILGSFKKGDINGSRRCAYHGATIKSIGIRR